MNKLETEFTEEEIIALITGYYMACQIANLLIDNDAPPLICAPSDRNIFLSMKDKLIAVLEKSDDEHS